MRPVVTEVTLIFSALCGVQNHRLIFPRLKWKWSKRTLAMQRPGTSITKLARYR